MVTNRHAPRDGDFVGRQIGGYVVDKLLGEGGMGSVYLATNRNLGRKAAIKVISRQYTQNPEVVGRFLREAQAVAALDDPNIIEIYDSHEFAEDGVMYIAMKYIDGHSLLALQELVRPMPLDGAIAIGLQVASGLDAAHELGIVHRDVKPANILISRRWRRRYFVTILDFGIAKLLDPHLAANFRTKTSLIVGTLSYMAPEQARGQRDIDARADIYSLGVVVYEMLTARRPYNEETIYGLVEKQTQREPFPRPRELRPEIPQIIDETLLDALQIDRNKRLSSMKEFAQRLASGMPNGDRLLSTLASRLCVDRPTAPNEPTLTGDVESSIASWAPARPLVYPRRRSLMPVTTGIGGIAIGSVVTWLVTSSTTVQPPAQAAVTLPSPTPPANATQPATPTPAPTTPAPDHLAVPPANAMPPATALATTRTQRAAPGSGTVAAVSTTDPPKAAPIDSGVVQGAPAAPMAKPAVEQLEPHTAPAPLLRPPVPKALSKPPETAVASKGTAGKPPSSGGSSSANEAVSEGKSGSAKTGAIVVRAHPWADVWMDGKRLGTTPLRIPVAVGHYAVKLTNETREVTLPADVRPSADTVIEKTW